MHRVAEMRVESNGGPARRAAWRRALRLAAGNLLVIGVGLVLLGLAGEAWLRLTTPFMSRSLPLRFVPGVGLLIAPHAEVRWTNRLDFWTITRTNRLGFPDRPLPPGRAAAGCRVAVIGDSMIEAMELPIADKLHVRLEELATQRFPRLAVTTAAFGKGGTGQINQLAFYDEYVRRLRPRLLVLVFTPNDFVNNFPLLEALQTGWDPDGMPYVTAARDTNGDIVLRPPEPDYRRLGQAGGRQAAERRRRDAAERAARASWFATWLAVKIDMLTLPGDGQVFGADPRDLMKDRVARLRRRPGYAALLDGWRPTTRMIRAVADRDLPPAYQEALRFTAFGLDQFKKRADRDGAALVILAAHRMKAFGPRPFDRLLAMAAERGIPVVDQHDYIVRQGAEPASDAQWAHDPHWNAAGHRWAAEALLEHLAARPEVCDAPADARSASSPAHAP